MIEGIKKIREAFKRITERIKRTETIFDTKTEQALRLSENLEKMKEVREKMMVTGEKISKALEERSKQINNRTKEVPGEAIIFADGEKVVKLTNIENVQIQAEAIKGSRIVYGMIEQKMPKALEYEITISNIKGEARKQFRSIHNEGNNRRKMNGQPLKRFMAKQKVRKRKVSDSDTMK